MTIRRVKLDDFPTFMDNLRRIRTLAAEYDLEYHVGTTGDIGLRRANLILQGYNGILFYADVSSIRRGARRITSRGFEIRFPSRHSRRRGKAFVLVEGNTASRSLSGTQVRRIFSALHLGHQAAEFAIAGTEIFGATAAAAAATAGCTLM